MSYKDDIRTAIRKMSIDANAMVSVLCQVLEVDIAAKTCYCAPVNGGADIPFANLLSTGDKKGFLIIPKVDSFVMVTMTSEDDGFVSMFGAIESIYLNSDNYGGLIKIEELVTKLNNLENKVNSIISTYNTHTHPYVNVSTPATTSASASQVTGTLTPTQKADLENTTVKHGNGT